MSINNTLCCTCNQKILTKQNNCHCVNKLLDSIKCAKCENSECFKCFNQKTCNKCIAKHKLYNTCSKCCNKSFEPKTQILKCSFCKNGICSCCEIKSFAKHGLHFCCENCVIQYINFI